MKTKGITSILKYALALQVLIFFTLSCSKPTKTENKKPLVPASPTPAVGISNVSIYPILSWTGGDPDPDDIVIYNVYLGTDPTPDETELLYVGQSNTSCEPSALSYNTAYYWKIVAKDSHGAITEGPIWDFSTEGTAGVATSQTDNQGKVTLQLGSYNVEVGVKNENGSPISDINIQGTITPNYLTIIAQDQNSRYYPSIKIIPLTNLFEYHRPASLNEEKGFIVIAIVVITVGLAVYEFATNPPYITEIRNEEGIVKKCLNGDASDILSVLTLVTGPFGGIGKILHLGPTAASRLGVQGARTIALTEEAINGGTDLFVALLSEAWNIFDEDWAWYCWYENTNGKAVSALYIDDVELRRNFAYRFTLTWGENPSDLDCHLWTPAIYGNTYHVYFGSRGSLESAPYAELDVDDMSGYGPENITVKQSFSGTYTYAIHHWAGGGTITTSNAHVRVVNNQQEILSIGVPNVNSGSNWWWHVCDIDGGTGQLTVVNQVTQDAPHSYLNKGIIEK